MNIIMNIIKLTYWIRVCIVPNGLLQTGEPGKLQNRIRETNDAVLVSGERLEAP